MLLPIDLPPGFYRNGTELQSQGRWRDGNLVRWKDGSLRPVKGWLERVTAAAVAPRGALAWTDLSGDRRFAVGTYSGLYAVSASGTVTDITPGTLTSGNLNATLNTGYGGGFYGSGFYGTPRPDNGAYEFATTWALDNWGQNLIACSDADGVIYQWDLNVANDGVAVTNAPTDNASAFVTEERFLVALGAGGNPRLVQWSDREDLTTWTPASTNEAGDLELQTGGEIMCGLRARGQSLILTDLDAHTMTYQGPPFVYGFERVGSSCGTVSRKAAASVDSGVYWMGRLGFYRFSGGVVEQLPCDVSDHVFADINRAQQSKTYAVANSLYNEVWWFYPSSGSNENDRYVAYSYDTGYWTTGTLARTAGIDAGVFATPIWFDADGVGYDHETGSNYDEATVYAESGPIVLDAGDRVAVVTSMLPDEVTQGDVTATFKTRFYPNGTEREYGPYSMANPTSVRFTGRQIRMRVTGNVLTDWRVGIPRLDVRQGGRR